MNGNYDVWVVSGHNHAHQITADIAKIARVPAYVGIHLHRVQNHPKDLALGPTLPAHFILRVVSKSHALLRARQLTSLPLDG